MDNNLLKYIQDGQLGYNKALPIGIEDPKEALIGVLPKHYYLIGADSGVGKTTFTDFNFLLTPYFNKPENIDVQWFYYSLELGASMKKMSWLNYVIHKEEGVILPLSDLAGFKGNKLTSKQLELIEKYSPIVEKLAEDIRLVDDTVNPTRIYYELMDFAKKNGKLHYKKYEADGKQLEKLVGYTPNNPNQRVIIIVDHIALLASENNKNTKQTMDLLSEYMVKFRNIFGYTPVIVQQFNTSQEAQSRTQNKNTMRITPGKSDFGDSTYTWRDCDIALGGVCPARYEIASFRGYNVNELKESLTFWFLIKNRWIGKSEVYALERLRDLPILKKPNNGINSNQ
jgi:hypothetical protein